MQIFANFSIKFFIIAIEGTRIWPRTSAFVPSGTNTPRSTPSSSGMLIGHHRVMNKSFARLRVWVIIKHVQLGTSSRSIHGGAYFSGVSGRKFNLTTVLRPVRPLACYWMVFFPPSVTFVLVFTDLPSPSGLARYFQVDLSPKRLDGFLSNHTECISPNRP